ncbi:MAG TPA: LytR family transcriptional regulator [candidate division Zixibacteria bacterium]|nr:LytR family transcriptional regulator [candidate division Zixibacteria bacterium]
MRFIDWAIIIVVLVAGFFIVAKYLMPPKHEPSPRVLPDKGAIKVELFGGCGRRTEVLKIADMLREIGIDVVDIKQESGFLYPASLIVDRTGAPLVADSLARLVGLPPDRVVIQRYNLMFDATIVVGLDYLVIIEKLKGITS